MSIVRVNRIENILIRRRGDELLRKLNGLNHGGLVEIASHDISWHEHISSRNALMDSVPAFLFPIENSFELISREFELFFGECENELLVSFEKPFIFKLSLRDPGVFLQSFFATQGTCDITAICERKKAIFESQELEYEVKIFVDVDKG